MPGKDASDTFLSASRSLIVATERLAGVGVPFPTRRDGQAPFIYARDLLDWVLERPNVTMPDMAQLCFTTLNLLGVDHAVPEVDAWSSAYLAFEAAHTKPQGAHEGEGS